MARKIEFEIPVRTVSESNQREHWAVKAKRAKHQRGIAEMFARQWTDALPPKPWRIKLTRYGVRRLDSGNNPGAMKAVQDGLCDALGIDDGDEVHEWVYAQQKRTKKQGEPGVGVEIKTLDAEG